jgi:hypothetical protein
MWKYHSQLASSFFTLTISQGIADILFTLFKLIFITLAKTFYRDFAMRHEELWATMGLLSSWTIYWVVICHLLAITINRFTALVWPMKYKHVRG